MALIKKSDLQYNYSWTTIPGDSSRVTGKPDSTRFSRNEGYEVLYLINTLASEWNFKKVASALKIERLINDHLPSNIQSQEKVKQWIYDNWKLTS
ncbi:hypothetical protein [Vibrio campbellii]|uniref:hypothetical protein n=1 Tax=Vibrio campbellii TaxID=680 RepID=UPI0040560832